MSTDQPNAGPEDEATLLPPPEQEAAARQPSRRSLALFAALLVALNILLLVVLGFIAREQDAGTNQAQQAMTAQLAALRERVSKLETALTEAAADTSLQERVSALEAGLAALPKAGETAQAPPPSDQSQALEALTKRVAELEAKPAPGLSAVSGLEQRVAGLEGARLAAAAETAARIDAIDKDLKEAVKPALAGLAQSAPQLATKTELQSLADRLAAFEASEERLLVKAASLALSVSVLSDAVKAGMPYQDELSTVRRLAAGSPQESAALDVLGRQAGSGIPTLDSLIAAFPPAARAAKEAETPPKSGMMGALGRLFGDLVSFRSPGASAEKALDAMAAALRRDDLAQLLAASQTLDPKARAALEPWLARARLRQSGLSAVATLRNAAVRQLAAAGTQ